MNQLRLESDELTARVEDLQNKIKELEAENLSKDQQLTSMQHQNGVLEAELERLEKSAVDLKKAADEGTQHGTQNESLTRRMQLLEEEAEKADKVLREAHEQYVATTPSSGQLSPMLSLHVERCFCRQLVTTFIFHPHLLLTLSFCTGFDRLTSRLDTLSGECKHWRPSATLGKRNTTSWSRSTTRPSRSWKTSRPKLALSKKTAVTAGADERNHLETAHSVRQTRTRRRSRICKDETLTLGRGIPLTPASIHLPLGRFFYTFQIPHNVSSQYCDRPRIKCWDVE